MCINVWLSYSFLISLLYHIMQDSFEIPRGESSRGGDLEMGVNLQNSGELGLQNFSKKVTIYSYAPVVPYLCLFLRIGTKQ